MKTKSTLSCFIRRTFTFIRFMTQLCIILLKQIKPLKIFLKPKNLNNIYCIRIYNNEKTKTKRTMKNISKKYYFI